MKPFVAVYTNECKAYCDQQFIASLKALDPAPHAIRVVDNSRNFAYHQRLLSLCPMGTMWSIDHITVLKEPFRTLFHRNVAYSLAALRTDFLESDADCFITIESDVFAPPNLLALFAEVFDQADIIGGIYYRGFHTQEAFDPGEVRLEPVHHVLSGCTLYKRAVLEKLAFRWDADVLGAFPDAFMSHDATEAGFRLANYNKIKCLHMHAPNGGRGWDLLR